LLVEDLTLISAYSFMISQIPILAAAALWLAEQANLEYAVEIYGLALCYPLIANSLWFEVVVGHRISTLAEGLSPTVLTAARARGQARSLDTTIQELQQVFS
jgi:hypothetical protein